MPSIDERVVAMAFENQVFEQRVAQTISTLGKLDAAVKNISNAKGLEDIEKAGNKVTLNAPMSALDKLRAKLSRSGDGAAQGFNDIEKASNKVTLEGTGKAVDKTQAKLNQLSAGSTFTDIERDADRVTLSGLTRAIDGVSNHFSVLAGAASVALGGIASQAAMKGAAFGKSFAFGPITDGLNEYKTNLSSIQTILANTEGQQVSGLGAVKDHLNELNRYSDQTIYNFSEMAKNIGTFTAAGVDLDTSTQSIKGIANLAALSGSNSQQASTAMYQLSQAIAAGRVGLQDWNSVVNAGMGGAVFQKALMKTAVAMGALKNGAVEIDKATGKATVNGESFRNSIMAKPGEQSWLSSDVLTTTLKNFTGDMKEADLIAQGFTKTQAQAIMQQAKTAKAAATEVKTLSQAFDVAKETIGSGWAQTFQLIFGDFNESKKTFTEFSNTLNGFINNASAARNKVLGDWKKLGGRTVFIDGIKQAFENLMSILSTIKDAFRDVFPASTGKDLFNLTQGFAELMKRLEPSQALLSNLRSIFGGLFAVLHIGWSVVKGVVGVIADLLGVVGQGSGGVLDFAGSIGEFLKSVDQALTKGGLLNGFFQTLTNILKAPLTMISAIATAIFGMFSGADPEKAKGMGDALATISDKIKPMAAVLDKASGAWDKFKNILQDVGTLVSPWFNKIADEIANLGNILADAVRNADFDMVFSAINTGLFGGLVLAVRKFLGGGLADQIGGGLLKNLSNTFGQLTNNLQAMQKNLQASALLKIAAAVGVLAAGVFLLSKIPADKLASALSAMTIGFGQLIAVMAVMGKLGGGITFTAMAAGMVALATSMVILAGAVKIFATMNWDEIARGLTGVAGSMVAIGVGMQLLGPGTLIQGPALIAIGLALNVIAAAVKQFASLKWEDLAKGVAGMAASLAVLAGAMFLFPPNMAIAGVGLIAMSIGVTFLASAIAAMGSLDVKTIAKGVIGIALAMVALSVAILGFPPTLALQAAGLVVLSIALSGIAGAIGIMGSLSIGKLVKGLIAMGAALGILSVGLYLMTGTAGGALALIAAAGAFAILAPTLALLGNLAWGTIFKGLAAIALTLGTLAIVGALAATPLALLGAALVVLGAGMLVLTIPIYILAKALALLGSEGVKGVGVMVAALTAFVALLPKIIIDFVKGLVGIIAALAEVAPKVVESLGIIIGSALAAISLAIPKMEQVLGQLFGAFVRIINAQSGPVINAGIKLLLNFLTGVSQNISKVVQTASDIVVKFLDGLRNNAPRLTSAGLGTMVAFLTGISNGIPRIVGKVADMVAKFLSTVTARIPGLVAKGAEMVIAFINGIASKVGGIVAAGARLIGQFLIGVGNKIPDLVDKGLFVARKFLNGIADGMVGLAHIGFTAIIRFLNGIEREIRNNSKTLIDAGRGVGDAIFDGVAMAIDEAAGPIIDKLKWVFSKLPGPVKKVLGIHSPSTVFAEIGKNTMEGFSKGVIDNRARPDQAVSSVAKGTMQTFSQAVLSRRTGAVSQFHEVGRQSMEGLKRGIKEQEPSVKSSGISIAGGLVQSMKDFLKIRSPSQVLRDIGKEVGRGFKDGLDGSADDIRGSFRSLREQINGELKSQRNDLKEERKKLRDLEEQHATKLADIQELKKHPVRNAEEIASAQKDLKDIESQIRSSGNAIAKYNSTIGALNSAHGALVGDLQAEKQKLIDLANELGGEGGINDQLDKANQDLSKIIDDRKQFVDATTEQFSKLPDINKDAEDQVADYRTRLQKQIDDTKAFYETMKKLRAAGLDDVTFKKLLSEGVGSQDFADELLKGGEAGIKSLNAMDTQLGDLAKSMGDEFGTDLFDVGQQAAQGIVDGLVKRKGEIEDAMASIADALVDRIKSALGIKSPSKIMMDIAKNVVDGFTGGIASNKSKVQAAAQSVVDATRNAFTDLSTVGLEVDPTITPVLDLSQVKKDAQQLSDLTNVTPITAAASFGQASAISEETAAAAAAADQTGGSVTQVSFEQNNYSPESLSDVEIYRKTNNQLSQLKSAIGLPA